MSLVGALARRLPAPVARSLRALKWRLAGRTPVGSFDFGDFRNLAPVDRDFGYSRGLPIDRHYIERFLASHGADVGGRVLEVGDDEYTRRFGGARVTASDVLHVHAGNPKATLVARLEAAPQVPDDTFDAIILTQTLSIIYDLRAAVATLHRILKPGGVLLVTVPGVTCVPARSEWAATWCWSFTEHSLRRLLEEAFGAGVETATRGNVLAAVAFLEGLCAEELRPGELDHLDPDYPVTITARAVKARRAA